MYLHQMYLHLHRLMQLRSTCIMIIKGKKGTAYIILILCAQLQCVYIMIHNLGGGLQVATENSQWNLGHIEKIYSIVNQFLFIFITNMI